MLTDYVNMEHMKNANISKPWVFAVNTNLNIKWFNYCKDTFVSLVILFMTAIEFSLYLLKSGKFSYFERSYVHDEISQRYQQNIVNLDFKHLGASDGAESVLPS